MSFSLLFWILMLIWFVFGWVYNSAPATFGPYGWWGSSLLLFILLGLLGWGVFGAPVHQ